MIGAECRALHARTPMTYGTSTSTDPWRTSSWPTTRRRTRRCVRPSTATASATATACRPALRIEPLDETHARARLDCADDAINAYLRSGLDRDVGRYGCVAYMATLGDRMVVGFYTLSKECAGPPP